MKISCVCPTTESRREFLPKMIACYQAQSHEDKELVIVTEPGWDVAALVPTDESIRVVFTADDTTVGGKRNLGNQHATGEAIAHFDDDDYSAPGRLTDQLANLTEKAVTGYHTVRCLEAGRWYRNNDPNYLGAGTSLFYRRDWWTAHPFIRDSISEDNIFSHAARNAGQIITTDGTDFIFMRNHGANTCERTARAPWWDDAEPFMIGGEVGV